MREIKLTPDDLVSALLNLPNERNVCLLDSCGVSHLGSRFLIAGFDAAEILEINEADGEETLKILDEKLLQENLAAIFTISYDLGLKLNGIVSRPKKFSGFDEPDVFLALFDCLIVHDYKQNKTFITGNEKCFDRVEKIILSSLPKSFVREQTEKPIITANFTREKYVSAIEQIQERIRNGDTYQTNLTRQLRVRLPDKLTAEQIFFDLRKNHPAPFASFIRRKNDCVVSASPERFFKIQDGIITTSPIKGTRPRGRYLEEDLLLKNELLTSEKDRAENVMIVDLLRNDIGKICKFGSVAVEKLCEPETHTTLFHLVSTISGTLLDRIKFSDVLRAIFPCGSITGAPKISTMRIIDQIETAPRGLSMGAIGFSIQNSEVEFQNIQNINSPFDVRRYCDLSVAIRTMVVRGDEAIFNVGGGIMIDSVPELEHEETTVKARALLEAIGANEDDLR